MDGGTFTISNGGVFGSMFGTPIINPPQSAILGMHATFDRPVAINGKVCLSTVLLCTNIVLSITGFIIICLSLFIVMSVLEGFLLLTECKVHNKTLHCWTIVAHSGCLRDAIPVYYGPNLCVKCPIKVAGAHEYH